MDVTITHTLMHLPGQAADHGFQSILDRFLIRINALYARCSAVFRQTWRTRQDLPDADGQRLPGWLHVFSIAS
jgi:hypothetical protein